MIGLLSGTITTPLEALISLEFWPGHKVPSTPLYPRAVRLCRHLLSHPHMYNT